MGFVLMGGGALLMLVGLVCSIIILVNAFKSSALEGLLCMFLPFYGLYWMFVKFQHESKGSINAGALLGPILGQVLFAVAAGMMGVAPH